MAKILFDITVAQESAEWLHCHLVMEISCHIFSYAVMNQDKKLLQLRIYGLDAHDNHELAEELEGILGTDAVLQTGIEKKTCIYNFPESQLVPEKHFHRDAGAALIELLHGDLSKGITLSERIQDSDQYNVYQVPAEIHGLLQQHFTNSKYWHYYTIWMICEQKQVHESSLSVLFYPNRILVSAVKDKELQLLQSYVYEAAEDVAYYLLNICQQLQLPPENTPVVLSGMIDVSSVLYTEIFKYFGKLSLEAFPAAAAIPALEEYPSHFFSPLLKLAECVS
jgi:hypothetical protein